MEKKFKITFNKPYLSGNEYKYIANSVQSGKISGNGVYTQQCQKFFEKRYELKKTLLTTSCTDALEMCAILLDIVPGDEVIVPSYTFVSTALAFVRQGADIVFADSRFDEPNLNVNVIEALITEKTRAIVVVHYAGVAVDMDKIMQLAVKYNLKVIEDAAQAIDSYYKEKPLGSIGHLGTFSFHETKNIISGEGGLLIINDDNLKERSEIIWEKGTNRASFFRGEVNKYGWVDTGSSFLPSDMVAAYLYAQLENIDDIQTTRKKHWNQYRNALETLQVRKKIRLPYIPEYATNNAHMFYIICKSLDERNRLINFLRSKSIHAVFHYLSLHKSDFYLRNNAKNTLPMAELYTDRLLRLPMFYELTSEQIEYICDSIIEFYDR